MSEDCPHCVFEKTEANCRGCFEGSHYKPKPQTNADRIRQMTDAELAVFLNDVRYDIAERPSFCDSCLRTSSLICRACWLGWLKQEAQDG